MVVFVDTVYVDIIPTFCADMGAFELAPVQVTRISVCFGTRSGRISGYYRRLFTLWN